MNLPNFLQIDKFSIIFLDCINYIEDRLFKINHEAFNSAIDVVIIFICLNNCLFSFFFSTDRIEPGSNPLQMGSTPFNGFFQFLFRRKKADSIMYFLYE